MKTNERFERCIICNKKVPIINGKFNGVRDNYILANAICNKCSKIWNNNINLLKDDKSNFSQYVDFVRRRKNENN